MATATFTSTVNTRTSQLTFDGASRSFNLTSPAGRQMTRNYDAKGHLTSISVPGLASSTLGYNSQGNVVSMNRGGRTYTLAYDAQHRLASVTDPVSRTLHFEYDTADRVTREILPDGREVHTAYDASGNLTSLTPPGSPAHTFSYTSIDLPSGYVPPVVPNGGATSYVYNKDRQLTRITRPDATAVALDYDSAARLSSVAPGWRIRLVDATTVSRAGSKGTDHRVHLSINLARNHIDEFELTSAKGGETLDRFVVRPGEIMIADAGYAHREALARVVRQGGSFIVRFAWSNLPLETMEGEPFELMQALEGLPEAKAGDFPVAFRAPDGQVIAARVVAIRKSEPAASAARKRLLQERSKKGRKVDIRTLQFASYIFVLTNLPADLSAESVLELYRFRWQIEMKFKTLKSLLHLDDVPVRTDAALKVYVLAKMLVALLIDALIEKAESFSP